MAGIGMDVSESDKKLWDLIRQHGLEAGRAEWESWRIAQLHEQEARLNDRRFVRLTP